MTSRIRRTRTVGDISQIHKFCSYLEPLQRLESIAYQQERLCSRGSDVKGWIVFFSMLAVLFLVTATKAKVFCSLSALTM